MILGKIRLVVILCFVAVVISAAAILSLQRTAGRQSEGGATRAAPRPDKTVKILNRGDPRKPPPSGKHAKYDSVTLFYGTNRKRTGDKEANTFYGTERGTLELGSCKVSVPVHHAAGRIERPSIWRFEFFENPQKHVVLNRVTPQPEDEVIADLQAAVAGTKDKSAFVFIHGFNVPFKEAAWRTAQMAYDLEFTGVPLFFSWPSQSRLSKDGYIADLQTTEWAAKDLLTFLSLVRTKSGADRVHVIAHSMGNKLLAEAVARVGDQKEAERTKLNEIILTAPDIDVDVFKRDFAKPLVAFAERVTLYASSNDFALQESKKQAGHYQRVGESYPTITIAPGIESIDASAVDTNFIGHFYYADSGSVITDIFYLFRDGKGADDRFLKKRMLGNDRYWLLKP